MSFPPSWNFFYSALSLTLNFITRSWQLFFPCNAHFPVILSNRLWFKRFGWYITMSISSVCIFFSLYLHRWLWRFGCGGIFHALHRCSQSYRDKCENIQHGQARHRIRRHFDSARSKLFIGHGAANQWKSEADRESSTISMLRDHFLRIPSAQAEWTTAMDVEESVYFEEARWVLQWMKRIWYSIFALYNITGFSKFWEMLRHMVFTLFRSLNFYCSQ